MEEVTAALDAQYTFPLHLAESQAEKSGIHAPPFSLTKYHHPRPSIPHGAHSTITSIRSIILLILRPIMKSFIDSAMLVLRLLPLLEAMLSARLSLLRSRVAMLWRRIFSLFIRASLISESVGRYVFAAPPKSPREDQLSFSVEIEDKYGQIYFHLFQYDWVPRQGQSLALGCRAADGPYLLARLGARTCLRR